MRVRESHLHTLAQQINTLTNSPATLTDIREGLPITNTGHYLICRCRDGYKLCRARHKEPHEDVFGLGGMAKASLERLLQAFLKGLTNDDMA
jgi:hypothetical protein